MLVMNAVRCHPENRTALKDEGSANCQKIFHPLWGLITAMCKQAVVAHADSQAARNPPEDARGKKRFPCEKKQCGDGAHVEGEHETRGYPIDLVVATFAP